MHAMVFATFDDSKDAMAFASHVTFLDSSLLTKTNLLGGDSTCLAVSIEPAKANNHGLNTNNVILNLLASNTYSFKHSNPKFVGFKHIASNTVIFNLLASNT